MCRRQYLLEFGSPNMSILNGSERAVYKRSCSESTHLSLRAAEAEGGRQGELSLLVGSSCIRSLR